MKRRSFILLSALGVSAVGICVADLFNLGVSDRYALIRPELLSRFCDDETISNLGRAFLALEPSGQKRDSLANMLYGGRADIESLPQSEIRRIQAQLRNSIYQDFDTGDTVILKGWVLSLTEARQCALYFILNS
jgi:hypothetical protein